MGTIPGSLSRLANLQALELQNNSLAGTVPAQLSVLTRLTLVNVCNNSASVRPLARWINITAACS